MADMADSPWAVRTGRNYNQTSLLYGYPKPIYSTISIGGRNRSQTSFLYGRPTGRPPVFGISVYDLTHPQNADAAQ